MEVQIGGSMGADASFFPHRSDAWLRVIWDGEEGKPPFGNHN